MSRSQGAGGPKPRTDAMRARARSSSSAPTGRGSRFAVLIVESSLMFREYLKDALQARLPFLALSTASSVKEALLRIEADRPGLVFIDVHLPDGQGFELARRIRQMSLDARVAFLSGYDLPEYRVAAYRCGADHYLAKGSVSIVEISTLVESVVAARGAP